MRVLVFESKRLGYASSWCFAEMICRGLELCGVSVKRFSLEEDIAGQEQELKKLTGEQFDGIIDINSLLPHVVLDDKYFLDYFDAPFFHFIVDHPMHLHSSLVIPLKHYRVICLDYYHKEYLEHHYPHIEKVYVFPFGGISASEFTEEAPEFVAMQDRKYDVLFPGTYTPSGYYRTQMEHASDFQYEIAQDILCQYRQGSRRPMEELFAEQTKDQDFFALQMYNARMIDRYIREWYREFVLNELLCAGIHVDVVGSRWELFRSGAPQNLHIHPPCSYPEQLMLLGQSRMVLNVQPLFWDGVHDRVVNAMANYSIALTDSCGFIEREFEEGKELLVYDKNNPGKVAHMVCELLQSPDKLEKMAVHAKNAVSRHSWTAHIENFLESLLFH